MQDLVEFTNNNLLYVAAFMVSGFAVLIYEIRLKGQSIGSLSTPVAVRVINGGAAIIDMRPPEQFSAMRIIDSKNVPEAELTAESLAKHKKGTLLVCDSGARSSAAAAKLRKAGVENVFSLQGGINAWQQENLPVASGDS